MSKKILMRQRKLQTGLLLALSLLVSGCAQIIGADFDKPFQSSGAGGGSTTASAGTGNMVTTGSTGGGGSAAVCDLGGALLTDTLDLDVWAKDVVVTSGGAQDFFTSSATISVPAGAGFTNKVASYKLFSAPDPGNRVLLYQCFSEGHNITAAPVGTCDCMGYAVQILGTSTLNKDDYVPLTRITGQVPEATALIPVEDESTGGQMCLAFGNTTIDPKGCTAVDMLYGAK